MWVSVMAASFDLLCTAAASATEPGCEEVAKRYEGASESTTVASHVRHRPFFHRTNVRPSRRFPSSLSNPDGLWWPDITAFKGPQNKIVNLLMASRSPSTPSKRQAVSTPGAQPYCLNKYMRMEVFTIHVNRCFNRRNDILFLVVKSAIEEGNFIVFYIRRDLSTNAYYRRIANVTLAH